MATTDNNAFEELVTRVIEAYRLTYNDTTSLDSLGVLGKQRILILENARYKRETKILKAQRTLRDLKEIDNLIEDIDRFEDDEELPPAAAPAIVPDGEDEPAEQLEPELEPEPEDDEWKYDPRNPDAIKRPKGKEKVKAKEVKTEKEKKPVGRPPSSASVSPPSRPKKFDKSSMDMRLRLLAQRREIMDTVTDEDERESDAMNLFFIPVTAEEMAEMDTVEVTEGTRVDADFGSDIPAGAKTALGSKNIKNARSAGPGFHFEEEGGERVVVED